MSASRHAPAADGHQRHGQLDNGLDASKYSSPGALDVAIELRRLTADDLWEQATALQPYLPLMLAARVRYQSVLTELRRRAVVQP